MADIRYISGTLGDTGVFYFCSFDPSPFTRYTFWSLVIGGFFTTMTLFGSNQAMIQRYLAMPSTRKAQM